MSAEADYHAEIVTYVHLDTEARPCALITSLLISTFANIAFWIYSANHSKIGNWSWWLFTLIADDPTGRFAKTISLHFNITDIVDNGIGFPSEFRNSLQKSSSFISPARWPSPCRAWQISHFSSAVHPNLHCGGIVIYLVEVNWVTGWLIYKLTGS